VATTLFPAARGRGDWPLRGRGDAAARPAPGEPRSAVLTVRLSWGEDASWKRQVAQSCEVNWHCAKAIGAGSEGRG